MINGYRALNLTKLDVLSGFATLKVAVAYRIDGQVVRAYPGNLHALSRVEVEYVELPGWAEDISKCRRLAELPDNCLAYVRLVERVVGVVVRWIGVGPGRLDTIEIPAE